MTTDQQRPPPFPPDHSGWRWVLGTRCPTHDAAPGTPCWDTPAAMCSARAIAAGARRLGVPSTRRPAPSDRTSTGGTP